MLITVDVEIRKVNGEQALKHKWPTPHVKLYTGNCLKSNSGVLKQRVSAMAGRH